LRRPTAALGSPDYDMGMPRKWCPSSTCTGSIHRAGRVARNERIENTATHPRSGVIPARISVCTRLAMVKVPLDPVAEHHIPDLHVSRETSPGTRHPRRPSTWGARSRPPHAPLRAMLPRLTVAGDGMAPCDAVHRRHTRGASRLRRSSSEERAYRDPRRAPRTPVWRPPRWRPLARM
jgi:hypothetical protein